jgi:hypothetical protein
MAAASCEVTATRLRFTSAFTSAVHRVAMGSPAGPGQANREELTQGLQQAEGGLPQQNEPQ